MAWVVAGAVAWVVAEAVYGADVGTLGGGGLMVRPLLVVETVDDVDGTKLGALAVSLALLLAVLLLPMWSMLVYRPPCAPCPDDLMGMPVLDPLTKESS